MGDHGADKFHAQQGGSGPKPEYLPSITVQKSEEQKVPQSIKIYYKKKNIRKIHPGTSGQVHKKKGPSRGYPDMLLKAPSTSGYSESFGQGWRDETKTVRTWSQNHRGAPMAEMLWIRGRPLQ